MKIVFEWSSGRFSTDCPDIAQMFARSPKCFQPKAAEAITDNVREAMDRMIGKYEKNGRRNSPCEETVDGIRIHVKTV